MENEYTCKRDFSKTPEPQWGEPPRNLVSVFVVQEHHASRWHCDFRIEASGVLKSWAVPKGVSLCVGEKRLAIRTEDHPLAYANFEGQIPKGQYGAGLVSVWDKGYYQLISDSKKRYLTVDEGIQAGHLVIELFGSLLEGIYLLQRFRNTPQEHWLLIKER